MERLTIKTPQGPALKMRAAYPSEEAAQEDLMRLFYVAVGRLAAYEDTMPLERAQELAQAEKDGRLVVLPCRGDTVYTIEEDYLNCVECKYRDRAYYQEKIRRVSCDMDNGIRCPIYVKEHKVSGFEITFDKDGTAVLSSPREFGYKGLERFSGIDGKVYYTREEAEAALKKREEK